MNNVIVADIFGQTPALTALSDRVSADKIVDPYDGKIMSFDNEAQAYSYFTEHVGLDDYVDKLIQVIQECPEEVTLIGFSVGASAIWQLSASTSKHKGKMAKGAICFYGSQIRHQTDLSPKFDIKLILPKNESHFDVCALQKLLDNKQRVTIIQVNYLHGFMNPHSNNFSQAGYAEYVALLQQGSLSIRTTE